jgi:hypothetical protein
MLLVLFDGSWGDAARVGGVVESRTGNLTTPRAGSKRAIVLAAHMRINPINFMMDGSVAKAWGLLSRLCEGAESRFCPILFGV